MSNRQKIFFLVCAVLVHGMAVTTWALKVDFNKPSAPSPGGWTGWTGDLGDSTSRTIAGVTITLTNQSTGGHGSFHWFGDYTASGSDGLEDMVEDGVGLHGDDSGTDWQSGDILALGLRFSGLTPNTAYEITTWHNHNWNTPTSDISVGGEVVVDGLAHTYHVSNSDSAASATFTFVTDASGVSPLLLFTSETVLGDPKGGGGNAHLQIEPNINGFELRAIATAYAPSPDNAAANVDTDVVLSWTPGEYAVSHDVYFGTDFDDVNEADNTLPVGTSVYKGNQALDANSYDPPGKLEIGKTYYWRIDEVNEADVNSPWTGRIWSFTVGGKAVDPNPVDGADFVPPATTLSWSAGTDAESHDVYFGTDFDNVTNADNSLPVGTSVYKGNQPVDANTYTPTLEFGTTYYWRVDEVSPETTVKGDVWSFETGSYWLVESFERYADSLYLLQDWVGFGGAFVNLSGDAYGGDKSMEIEYWNLFGFTFSEAGYTFAEAQDWTVAGAKALVLYFHGLSENSPERLYVVLEDATGASGTAAHTDPNDMTWPDWQQWNIDLGEFADGGVDLTAIKKIFVGLGDRDGAASSSGQGFLLVDEIRLYPSRCVPEHGPVGDLTDDCVVNFRDYDRIGNDWRQQSMTLVGTAPDDSKLLLWYKFNELTGSTAADSSGNGKDGIVAADAPNWNPDCRDDGCLVFDDDTAVVGDNIFTGDETSLTITAWLAGDIGTIGRYNTVVAIGTELDRFIRADVPSADGIVTWQAGETVEWRDVEKVDWLDFWNHYAFVKDAMDVADPNDDVMRIYVNGRLVVEETRGAPLVGHLAGAYMKVGAKLNHNNDYIGSIDDFRIYGYALTQDEVVGVAAGEGNDLYVAVRSKANFVDDDQVDFLDLALMADNWLVLKHWP